MSDQPGVALITGAARRVGRAIALELARSGWDIGVHYRNSEEDAKRTASEIGALGRKAALVQGDLADGAVFDTLIRTTVDQLGGLHALINNASVWTKTTIDDVDPASWQRHLDVNLTAPAMLARAAWPHLKARPPGFVINICDISGERPWADYIAYCVSKGGLLTLTRALARAMAPAVRVNGISPGVVMLPEDVDEQTRQAALRRVPLQHVGAATDVAKLVRYLLEEGTYITGQIINVDGGRSVV